MNSLSRVLLTLGIGMIVIGILLGGRDVAPCGSVFSHEGECDSELSSHVSLVIAFIGMGLTCLLAAVFAYDHPPKYAEGRYVVAEDQDDPAP